MTMLFTERLGSCVGSTANGGTGTANTGSVWAFGNVGQTPNTHHWRPTGWNGNKDSGNVVPPPAGYVYDPNAPPISTGTWAQNNVPYTLVEPAFGIYTSVNTSGTADLGWVTATPPFQVQPISATNGNCNYHIPSSPHDGGINVLLADGSVKFVSSSVSAATWWFAIMPNDGHSLGADW
jgi:prepilin-type processing-associated H-X9-DG protein